MPHIIKIEQYMELNVRVSNVPQHTKITNMPIELKTGIVSIILKTKQENYVPAKVTLRAKISNQIITV